MAISFLRSAARFLAPPSCIYCGAEGVLICDGCRVRLPRSPHQMCFGCGASTNLGVSCKLCRKYLAVNALTIASTYDGASKELVRLLKYGRQREAATIFADWLSALLDDANFDVVTAVPVATTRLRRRGYNQAELIARGVAHNLRVPYRPLLQRIKNIQQVGTHRAARLRQAETAYAARTAPYGMRILLVDDVTTTGGTLHACAKQLVIRNRANVWAAVAAYREYGHPDIDS